MKTREPINRVGRSETDLEDEVVSEFPGVEAVEELPIVDGGFWSSIIVRRLEYAIRHRRKSQILGVCVSC